MTLIPAAAIRVGPGMFPIGARSGDGHHRRMTTEQPQATQSPRLLRRRATNRVIGGVAAGIADYMNIDPVLVRAIFVGLVVFGGAGLVLYLVGWLLIPVEGRAESPLEQILPPSGTLVRLLLVVAAVAFLGAIVLPATEWTFGSTWPALIVVALVVAGIFLLRRGEPSEARAPAASYAAASTTAATPNTGFTQPAATEPRPRASRSPLGWYVTAAVLIVVGVAAMLDRATQLALLPGQFFGLALTVIGGGLVIGSWWGRARVLILPALLLLLIGIPAAFLTVPLEGGVGGPYHAPTSMEELQDDYQLAFGKLTLDLTQLPTSTEPVQVAASVGGGSLQVVVPNDVQVQVDTDIGAGASYVLGDSQGGTDLENHYEVGDLGRLIVLDLAVGIGGIEVNTAYDNQYELELGGYR
jgi:phage shock protein PspC (stress-responsive transcriptional regulator)